MIVLLGSNGQITSRLARLLLGAGHAVRVIGRNPVQNSARARSPPGKSWRVTISKVSRRRGRSVRSKPESSAIPPTRMRWSKRVNAIL